MPVAVRLSSCRGSPLARGTAHTTLVARLFPHQNTQKHTDSHRNPDRDSGGLFSFSTKHRVRLSPSAPRCRECHVGKQPGTQEAGPAPRRALALESNCLSPQCENPPQILILCGLAGSAVVISLVSWNKITGRRK